MKKEKSCGAVIVNDNNQVLLVKQTLGHYGFPKGHVEDGETEEETAIREVKEETNIDIEIIKKDKFMITYNVSDTISKDVIYFIAKPLSFKAVPQETEVAEILWVDINDVVNYLGFTNIIKLWNEEILRVLSK